MATTTVMQQIEELISEMPLPVLKDVQRRLTDWASSGGKEDDPYVEQQLRYMKHVRHAQHASK
ncbi:DUF6877 family protein [Kurthia populi]|uniref:DUF6877 family protein n=1 Tax=Kurthia populi TaxID=1562132 RepID=A0ABW5XX33_9BACL